MSLKDEIAVLFAELHRVAADWDDEEDDYAELPAKGWQRDWAIFARANCPEADAERIEFGERALELLDAVRKAGRKKAT